MTMKQVWCLFLLLQAAVHAASSCFSGETDIQAHPLSNPSTVRYLEPFDANYPRSRQVIVPGLRFNCAGYITGWGAHTLAVSRPNFIELLPHIITFQVWRPDLTNGSYSLVGSNQLSFNIRDNLTAIPGLTNVSIFSFERTVEQRQQIYFLPGDVLGWYIPHITTRSPLSPVFRDCDDAVVDIWHKTVTQSECTLCGVTDSAERIASTVPLVTVATNFFSLDSSSCVQPEQSCQVTMPPQTTITTATSPRTETTPITRSNQNGSSFTMTEIVCVVLAAVTFLLHIVMLALCAINLAVMKQIRKALQTRTSSISPGVRSPSTFMLGPINPHRMKAETPADYDPVKPVTGYDPVKKVSGYDPIQPVTGYEMIVGRRTSSVAEMNGGRDLGSSGSGSGGSNREGEGDESNDKMGSLASLSRNLPHSKTSSLSSINKLSDSRTGSREDLLRVKPARQDLV